MEFRRDNNILIGTVTSAPWEFTWSGAAGGDYAIAAVAYDTTPNYTYSAPIQVNVGGPLVVTVTAPAADTTFPLDSNITLTATATRGGVAQSLTNMKIRRNGNVIATLTSSPYTYAWNSANAGSYSIEAQATEPNGSYTYSAPIAVYVAKVPTISLTAPSNNSSLQLPGNKAVTANANPGNDGLTTLAKVEFFANGNLIQTVTSSPYTFNWTPALAGSYAITGVATDNLGQTKTSNTRTLNVSAAPSTVTVTSPTAGQVFNTGGNIPLTASVYDTTAAIQQVKFYDGANLLGLGTLQSNDGAGTSVYSYTWSGAAAGSYSITAQSTDSVATTGSSAVSMRVNAAPAVSLTSPTNGATFTAPATVNLAATATASDGDGTIAKVEFFQGSTLIATVSSAPFVYVWTNVAQGSYSITARATDNDGGITTSSAATITVSSGVAQLYFIHPDHLNTPRMIADATQTTVWKWEQAEPFGSSAPDEDPDGNSTNFEFNLRFPGQYFDKETTLSYNYFRDYDPAVGRYVQSDPIGLAGGSNTYAYVNGNPLKYIDPTGQFSLIPPSALLQFLPTPVQNQLLSLAQRVTAVEAGRAALVALESYQYTVAVGAAVAGAAAAGEIVLAYEGGRLIGQGINFAVEGISGQTPGSLIYDLLHRPKNTCSP